MLFWCKFQPLETVTVMILAASGLHFLANTSFFCCQLLTFHFFFVPGCACYAFVHVLLMFSIRGAIIPPLC